MNKSFWMMALGVLLIAGQTTGVWAQASSDPMWSDEPKSLSVNMLASSEMTPEQRTEMGDYADYYLGRLTAGQTAQHVAYARKRLSYIYANSLLQDGPRTLVNDRIELALPTMIKAEKPFVRWNGFILATLVRRATGLTPLAKIGLVDENVGVRYWAAKSLHSFGDGEFFEESLRADLVKSLLAAGLKESSSAVVRQIYAALAMLASIPRDDALTAMLKILEAQAVSFASAEVVDDRFEVAMFGFQSFEKALNRKLAIDSASTSAKGHLRQWGVALAKYLQAIAHVASAHDVMMTDNGFRTPAHVILRYADTVFNQYAVPSAKTPAAFESHWKNQSVGELQLDVFTWIGSNDTKGLFETASPWAIPYAQLLLNLEK